MKYLRMAGRSNRESRKGNGIQNRNRAVLAAAAAVLIFAAAGCGKREEPVPIEVSTGNIEEINEGLPDGAAEDVKDGKEPDEMADKAAEGDVREPEGSADGENGGTAERKTSGNEQPTEDRQAQSAGTADLEGHVTSVNGDSFVISKMETYSDGDADIAADAAPGYEKEEDLVTVHVSRSCVWEFKTVKNGGINPEDISTREGSFSDMKKDIDISMKGSWQDDGTFLADSIVLMEFV